MRFLLFILSSFLSSCAPIAVVGTCATGGYLARSEYGVGEKISDVELTIKIKKFLAKNKINLLNYYILIKNHDFLIVGKGSQEEKERITQLMHSDNLLSKHLKNVYIEISEDNSLTFTTAANDNLIHTRVGVALTSAGHVKSLNYASVVRNGVVYLLGCSNDKQEFDIVIETIQKVKDVKKIISFVEVKSGN